MARGRHHRRRQVPLVVGGLGAMVAGGCAAILVIGAPVVVGAAVAVGLAMWWILRRTARTGSPHAAPAAGSTPPVGDAPP